MQPLHTGNDIRRYSRRYSFGCLHRLCDRRNKDSISLMHHIVSELDYNPFGEFEPSWPPFLCNRVGRSRGFKGFLRCRRPFCSYCSPKQRYSRDNNRSCRKTVPKGCLQILEVLLKEVLECKSSVRLSASKPHSEAGVCSVSSAFLKEAAIIAEEDVTCSASSVVTPVSSGV